MTPEINPVEQIGIAQFEYLQSLPTRRGMLTAFPYLIKPPGITSIPAKNIFSPYPQPPRDPDVDCVRLAQGTHRHLMLRRGRIEKNA